MFLIHKHAPTVLDDFVYNKDVANKLLMLTTDDSSPHIIISGPVGAGKETLMWFYLRALFGEDVTSLIKEKHVISGSSNKKIVSIVKSNYHIMIEPTVSNYDKYVIQEVIQKYAMYSPIPFLVVKKTFKIIVINNAENLSNLAQTALRRTMETYAKTCRFVMVCNDLSKIIDPLKSRCCVFHVPLPTNEEIYNNALLISFMEQINIPPSKLKEVVMNSSRSMKNVIWYLDHYRLKIDNTTCITASYDVIGNAIKLANEINFVSSIEVIRTEIYTLMINNVRGSDIIIKITDFMIDLFHLDSEICIDIISKASDAEFNLILGRREIMHMDYFIIYCLKNAILYYIKHPEHIFEQTEIPKFTVPVKTIVPRVAKNNKTSKTSYKKN